MSIFVFLQTITFLVFSSSGPTTLHFDEPIEWANIGLVGEFSSTVSADRKNIEITPIKLLNDDWKPFVIRTKGKVYSFKIKFSRKDFMMSALVRDARMNKSYKLLKRTDSYEIYEGDESLRFVNLTKTPVVINEKTVESVEILPKTPFLLINESLVKVL